MSAPAPVSRRPLSSPATLSERAPGLARAHRSLRRQSGRGAPLADLDTLSRSITRAAHQFRTPKPGDPVYQKAGEWLLDNHYLVARTVRQVGSELPEGFRRRLPHVGGDDIPRVLRLAHALVEATSLDFDEAALLSFTEAYQKEAPLAIAELWAFPTMLRISVLEALVQMLNVFFPPTRARARWWDLLIDPAVGIERSIRALRLLAEIDWKTFFQRTSAVEALLSTDPSGVYALMDFETRDAYGKVVEDLAWCAERPEPEVARLAVSMAAEQADDPRKGHVGYYLVDRGRALLEKQIGYRPHGVDRLRRMLLAHPTFAYLGSVGGSTLLMLAALATWGVGEPGTLPGVALAVLAAVPLSAIAVAFTNWCVTLLLPPRSLPKLDFSERVRDDCKTAVVIPALVARASDLDALLAQLELHYLSSSDPALTFVLLTDHVDTDVMPNDDALLAYGEKAISALNQKHGAVGHAPFHLLHRRASWNPAEACFMAWERKRGKLEEFNRLLRGDENTSFQRHIGDPHGLEDIRFVITLDADTELPLGAAQKLIGLLAHPLNHAELDRETTRVISGYTVVQPRVETAPSAGTSWFSRIFAGDTALDIYSRAVSDVYQDLFGSGVYVGKGIYDVDSFTRSLDGRVPANALASHDLFEGIQGRAALATDVVLFEGYPHHYLAYARRMHRWIRGDWQLVPWLFSPGISLIDRWKIADNLRRSLFAPSQLALVLFGLLAFPTHAALWLLATLALPLVVLIPSLRGERWKESLGRWALGVAWLPYEAWLSADAIVRVLVRLTITRKRLLEWVTAAHTASAMSRSPRGLFWREMGPAVVVVAVLLLTLGLLSHSVLPVAAPLLVLWLVSPELARWSSTVRVERRDVAAEDRRVLRLLARRTWHFFETFVGPGDQWLPPDNYQHEPHARVAHRTSPTNIGVLLVSELAACDLGYIGPAELSAKLQHTFNSLARLEQYRGHWLNWYDTKTLEPLLPRYVSTVDSGNLAAALITLANGLRERAQAPVLASARWDGLVDTLELFEDAVRKLPVAQGSLAARVGEIRSMIEGTRQDPGALYGAAHAICEVELPSVEHALLDVLGRSNDPHDVANFREARTWLDRLKHQLRGLESDVETFFPWLVFADEANRLGFDLGADLVTPAALSLGAVGELCKRVRASLSAHRAEATSDAHHAFVERVDARLRAAATSAASLAEGLCALAAQADAGRAAMDFTFLYEPKRKLFHIGYNATSDRLDPHYYDLLASEARIASFLAVVQRQAPPTHWYRLGRQVTRIRGSVALLSWGGTMFEYLMPTLFMKSPEHTLLAQSAELAVLAHIDYGRKTRTPWGISESGFAELDAQHNYQYRSFGVPGLGLKRGLEDDLVIAPYACVLALSVRPREVLENLALLERMGALGTYGLVEAIDFHPTRSEEASRETAEALPHFALVHSHMAHHQGMILAALDNALNDDILVERFHRDPLVKAGELLLSERLPPVEVAELLARPEKEKSKPEPVPVAAFPAWSPERSAGAPEVALLTNGRLTTMVTDTGAGWTHWKGLAVTRGGTDATCDVDGIWIYVRDETTGQLWSATPAPTRARAPSDHVTFHPHKVEFHHREGGLSLRTEIAVAPLDDVEIRYVTVHNESDEPRTLTLASSMDPALEAPAAAARHPAFSRLFVECETLSEEHAILASRRKKSPDGRTLVAVHRAVWESSAASWAGSQIDRAAFIGRRRDARAPHMIFEPASEGKARSKVAIDPVVALALRVVLEPGTSVKVAFVTAVAKTRRAAHELSRRYGSLHTVRWAIRDAQRPSARRLEKAGITPVLLPDAMHVVSRLLLPAPLLRPRRARLSGPSKRQLWGHAISGDDPLLVVRVRDPAESPVVAEVLATYRYLRRCKVPVELVFLDESASGYQSDDPGGMRRYLAGAQVSSWLHQRGGIFVLATDQLGAEDRSRIEASARVFIDSAAGSLHEQWSSLPLPPPPLPKFASSLAPEREIPCAASELKLTLANPCGGFAEDSREYVIVLKDGHETPAPWCNVLANPEFGCLVSESSLGSSWSVNSGENRLTPWRNDPVSDTPSEALYLRDEETAQVWSPTPLPAGLGSDTTVRHGAGYTTYERQSHGLRQELTVFVPADAPVKILRLRLQNQLPRPRRLTATYYVEWVFGANREDTQAHVLSEFDASAQCLLARCAWNADLAEQVGFVTADRTPHGFTSDRAEFIGRSGTLAAPEALSRWGLAANTQPGVDPCAALQVHVDVAPDQALEMHFVLGCGRDRAHALELVERFRQRSEVDAAWRGLSAHWDGLLGAIQVETPDQAMNVLLNRWLLYQSLSSRFFARSAFYQSSGAFGFRDQLQDAMALVHVAPALVRAHILETASHQFVEGDVLHWWHPPVGRGVRTRCSDDLLWLPHVTAHYVAATGDTAILGEEVCFLSGTPLNHDEHDRYGEFAVAPERASLLEHCKRALSRGFTEGPLGLPLIGSGDWNDGMNRVGSPERGESVWLGWFVFATALAFADLLERTGEKVEAERWRERAEGLRGRIEQVAWDGAWYVRAFYADDQPLGSARSRSCRIDSIAQSWAVLSGAGERKRAEQALRSADELLIRERDQLVLLLDPPFDGALHDPGYIKAYPPGVRENGGQYTHAAVWLGWAHARLGDGAGAERIFRLLNPILRTRADVDLERYRVEPYVLAADIYSVAPFIGRGGWTWYTGAAAWMWRLGVEAILGIYRERGGLRFDPCIPPEWPGFEATIRAGDREVHIVVENPDRVGRGVRTLTLDGVPQAAPHVDLDSLAHARHEIHIVLGSGRDQAPLVGAGTMRTSDGARVQRGMS